MSDNDMDSPAFWIWPNDADGIMEISSVSILSFGHSLNNQKSVVEFDPFWRSTDVAQFPDTWCRTPPRWIMGKSACAKSLKHLLLLQNEIVASEWMIDWYVWLLRIQYTDVNGKSSAQQIVPNTISHCAILLLIKILKCLKIIIFATHATATGKAGLRW